MNYSELPQTEIKVYLDNGLIYSYFVSDANKAREHSAAIILGGYRHTDNQTETMEHFPPNRILKVKCVGGMKTTYPDKISGT